MEESRKNVLSEHIKELFCKRQGIKTLSELNDVIIKSRNNAFRVDKIKDISQFILANKSRHFVIIGDYDVDGIMSVLILMRLFLYFGLDVDFDISFRFSEGFGINQRLIDNISVPNSIIITCDNGIAAIDVVKYAKEKGHTVIVTDHHLPVKDENNHIVLPDADYIFDANAIEGSSEFTKYCGAGNCYKLAQEMLSDDILNKNATAIALLNELQTYAAYATICDVMELTGENYAIVYDGFRKMKYSQYATVGIFALLQSLELDKYCDAKRIGFNLGPCINAVSRLEDGGSKKLVQMFLNDKDWNNGRKDAAYVIARNEDRKAYTRKFTAEAKKQVENSCAMYDCPIVLNLPGCPEGIIGIIAGKVSEKYSTPAIITTNAESVNGRNILKGSGRAPEGYDLKGHLDMVPKRTMFKYGGHEGAAGLSIYEDEFLDFVSSIQSTSNDYNFVASTTVPEVEIDASEVKDVAEILSKYIWGHGCESPTFLIKNVNIYPTADGYYKILGDNTLIKLKLNNGIEAISFNCIDDIMAQVNVQSPKKADLIGTIGYNYFNGSLVPQIEFTSFHLLEEKAEKSKLASLLQKRCDERIHL